MVTLCVFWGGGGGGGGGAAQTTPQEAFLANTQGVKVHIQARSQGGLGGPIEPPILGSVCCACANMLPYYLLSSTDVRHGYWTPAPSPSLKDSRTKLVEEFYSCPNTSLVKLLDLLSSGHPCPLVC